MKPIDINGHLPPRRRYCDTTVVSALSLYKVTFTETCPGGGTPSTQVFNGVATLSTDDARLTLVATNEAETRAAALLFAKQP